MLNVGNIIKIIQNQLGIDCYKFDTSFYSSYIEVMKQWYKGYVPSFHRYKVWNGDTNVYLEKASLKMAKRVCEDHSSLVWNENLSISSPDEDVKKFLLGYDEMTGILAKNDFWSQGGKLYELTCALGTGAFELVVTNMLSFGGKIAFNENTKINIVRHRAENIIPLTWNNNGDIIEVAFADQYRIKNDEYIDLRMHVIRDGVYHIINKKLRVINNVISLVDTESVAGDFNTGSSIPWFSILKLPIINNFDIGTPLGASIYANSLDVLRIVDDAFSLLQSEMRHGGKKLFYGRELCDRDMKTGKVITPSDEMGRSVFYMTGNQTTVNNNSSVKDMIYEFNPTLRINDISQAIENSLNYLSQSCGLGNNYYKFDNGVVKTATEVISQNSSMWRNIRKNELAVEKMLHGLFTALFYVNNMAGGTKINIDAPVTVEFDTSILEDKTAVRDRELKEVELGILPKQVYLEKYYSTGRLDTKPVDDEQLNNNENT